MKHLFHKLALLAVMAVALSACSTAPAKPEPAPVVTKTTTDLMLEVRKAELELERTELMARLKFAVESDSEFVKGYIMGQANTAKVAPSSSTTQTILQAQAQADEVALRREEMAERNSGWNKGLQLFDRVVPVVMFSKGLSFQKWQIEQTNSQNRYTLDTVRGAQADGFAAGSGATLGGVNAGHSTTLGGISAGANAAAAGARAVQGAPTSTTTKTPSE